MPPIQPPNLLFCATDAGGVRNLAPVARLAAPRFRPVVLVPPTLKPLFPEFGPELPLPDSVESANILLDTLLPQAVVCGTARYPTAEASLTKAARQRGIPTFAIFDEWYRYRAHFADANGGFRYLPDRICCQDALALQEAQAEGIPADRLRITGSPALAELAKAAARFRDTPPPPPNPPSQLQAPPPPFPPQPPPRRG
ncbi:MAG: hypothetical protein HQL57_03055, partial [Magnetococcales bacterium]|nr:hypothetical protein [Magnetococcales bacterium]